MINEEAKDGERAAEVDGNGNHREQIEELELHVLGLAAAFEDMVVPAQGALG